MRRAVRKRLVCVLAGVVAAIPALGRGADPASAQARLGRALGVGVSSVLAASEIEMDGSVVGLFGRYRLDGAGLAAVAGPAGEPVVRLGPADDTWFAGVVDLEAEARLTEQRRLPRRLRSAGLARPVMVLLTRHQEEVTLGPESGLASARGTGRRGRKRLFLVELRGTPRLLLDLEVEHRSEDGYGGHDIGGLALRQHEGGTYLEGVRQDRLPASRARCLAPEPYPVRFDLAGSRFRELPSERSPAPCG